MCSLSRSKLCKSKVPNNEKVGIGVGRWQVGLYLSTMSERASERRTRDTRHEALTQALQSRPVPLCDARIPASLQWRLRHAQCVVPNSRRLPAPTHTRSYTHTITQSHASIGAAAVSQCRWSTRARERDLDGDVEVIDQLQPLVGLACKASSLGLQLASLGLELALIGKHMSDALVDAVDHLLGHVAHRIDRLLAQSLCACARE